MVTTFNTNPYYDDFDKKKNYVRILFKPGYAVQARELTQLQTTIQEQINRFGSSIFKEGSIVDNGKTFLDNVPYGVFENFNISVQNGDLLQGSSSNAKAKVINVDGSKIWFTSISGSEFDTSNDTVSIINTNDYSIRGNINFDITTNSILVGSRFSIEESIFFARGYFVYIEPSSLFIYDSKPSLRLGLTINENIVTSAEDSSLLDPAVGSYNYSAPGGDRFQIMMTLDSKPYDRTSNNIDLLASENFIELLRVYEGQIEKKIVFSELSSIEDTLARRTYDESGNYTVRPFIGKLEERTPSAAELQGNPNFNFDSSANLYFSLSPGKSYVRGYEFESQFPTKLLLDKARDVQSVSGAVSSYSYGDFIYVDRIRGNPSIENHPIITLRNSSGNTIGSAFINNIDYDSNVSSNLVYRLYLSNISFLGTNSVASIANVAITTSTPPFYANVSSSKYGTNVSPYIVSSYVSAAISTTPNKHVKTLLNVGVSDTVWYAKKTYDLTFVGSGNLSSCTINQISSQYSFIGSGLLDQNDTNRNYFAVVITAGAGPASNTILRYEDGLRVTVNSSSQLFVQYANTSGTNFGTGGGNLVKLYAKTALSSWQQKNKTLSSNNYVFNGNVIANTIIILPNPDGYSLTNISASNTSLSLTTDVTNLYSFDNGQRDSHYDYSTIRLIGSLNNIFGSNVVDRLSVTYQYFSHSGTDGFFTVDSYENSGVSYSQIPSYISTTGKKYELRESIDFRPVKTGSVTFNNVPVPVIGENIVFDYSYYLPRKDVVTVTKDKSFRLLKGISSNNPEYPEPPPTDMTIYLLDIGAYTYDLNDIKFKYVDNRRYTMRDIGKIDQRVERVEYYTSLNLLEKQAQEARIPSSIPGTDKFKSGILVDPFRSHVVGDLENVDYRCSMNFRLGELRPAFERYHYNFKIDSSTNIAERKNLLMLNYINQELASQKLSSRFRNLNPSEKSTWTGSLSLIPSSVSWIETRQNTLTLSERQGVFYDPSGQEYDEWLSVIRGLNPSIPGANTISNELLSDTDERAITVFYDDVVLNQTSATFVKSIEVIFYAVGLLPDSVMYMYTNNGYQFPNTGNIERMTELVFQNDWSFDQVLSSTTSANTVSITEGTNTWSAKIALISGNRMFIFDEEVTSSSSSSYNIVGKSLTINSVTNTVITRIPKTYELKTNDFGIVAGKFTILPNTIKAGRDLNFILSNKKNEKGETYAEKNFPATGIILTRADITLTRYEKLIPRPPQEGGTDTAEPPVSIDAVAGVGPCYTYCNGGHYGEMKIGKSPQTGKIDVVYTLGFDASYYTSTFSSTFATDSNTLDYTLTLPSEAGAEYSFGRLSTTGTPGVYKYGEITPDILIPVVGNSSQTITVKVPRSKFVYRGTVLNGSKHWYTVNIPAGVKYNTNLEATPQNVDYVKNNLQTVFPLPTMSCPGETPTGTSSFYFTKKSFESGKVFTMSKIGHSWGPFNNNAEFDGFVESPAPGCLDCNNFAKTQIEFELDTGHRWNAVNLRCEVEDIPGWTGIHSLTSDNSLLLNVNKTLSPVPWSAATASDQFPGGTNGPWRFRFGIALKAAFRRNYVAPVPYINGSSVTPFVKKGRIRVTVTETNGDLRTTSFTTGEIALVFFTSVIP